MIYTINNPVTILTSFGGVNLSFANFLALSYIEPSPWLIDSLVAQGMI